MVRVRRPLTVGLSSLSTFWVDSCLLLLFLSFLNRFVLTDVGAFLLDNSSFIVTLKTPNVRRNSCVMLSLLLMGYLKIRRLCRGM